MTVPFLFFCFFVLLWVTMRQISKFFRLCAPVCHHKPKADCKCSDLMQICLQNSGISKKKTEKLALLSRRSARPF